jgi:hypothetical protein
MRPLKPDREVAFFPSTFVRNSPFGVKKWKDGAVLTSSSRMV